ncbi:hypothetical protein [Methylobacterium persicinum]|uniref:Integrase n=1 Tax=Methylobacterium persicinum TaxID=374426 RepID=A0ABU0HSM1_9HYPH|nr:hypothetical protein [Methylobacterium persicinum]MDQ0444494.1 hypothetical protein [Methylobacterium persicinum]
MINPSPYLVPFAKVETLRERFEHHVRAAAAYDVERRERGETVSRHATVDKVLADRLASLDEMSRQDFVDAFSFFEGFTLERRDETVLSKAKSALRMTGDRPSALTIVNRWLKFVYLKLWCEGLVVLPLHFKLGSSFRNGEIRSILPPVATCHIDNPHRDMAAFGLSLTLASRWRTFAEIDLDTLGPFSLQLGEDYRKRELLGLRRRNPYSPFTSALWMWQKAGEGNGFRYSADDVRGYLYWIDCARRGTTDQKPSEFIPEARDRRRLIKSDIKANAARRVAAAQVELIEHDRQAEFKQAIIAGDKTLVEVRFEVAAERVNAPEDILEYARMLRAKGVGRGGKEEPYPSRMHAFPGAIWATWNDMFERYFALRMRQGFEGGSGWDTFRYVFQDYLCCYLPWWQELHPGIEAPVPADPSEFKRFGHWVDGGDETAPLPLLHFFDQTRHGSGKDGFNGFITDGHRFFEFCRGDAASLRMRVAGFDNPVVPHVDRKVVRGATKTNKTPIPTAVLPLLFRYAYACEAFFLELGQASLAGTLPKTQQKLIGTLHKYVGTYEPSLFEGSCGKVGFEFEGRWHDIETVPLLVAWDERVVMVPGEERPRSAFVPQLSGLRLVIAALETGIRFQGLQWLCRKTYRSLVDAQTATAELVPLIVNTDKVKDRPWKTLIVRRAYELLRREEAYQDMLADAFVERPVQYERRDHTRFAPVQPLFRGPQSDYPVGDKTYATAWERLIMGFAQWYERHMPGSEPLRMWRFEPDIDPMTKKPRVVMHLDGEEQRPCCPLRVRLRHTPHSARSTFITARSGILPIEVTGWLVGQTNKATTYHYTVESEEEIGRKILSAASSLWEPDRENPVHIRADGVNSALRRSFEADRSRTETAFGFQTLSLLNAEAPDADGVELLRSTPMGHVVFRETHICPVGEMCPSNLMDVLVEPRRCGVCPLAVKSVDHLPSIGAKCRHLLEQVREGAKVLARMRARGEPSATIEQVQQRRKVDLMEYEGWRTSLHTLTAKLEELQAADNGTPLLHVGMPDAVRLHLKLVTRDADLAEFLLHRICDSAGHAGFETPTVRAQAAQLKQRLLASTRALDAEIDLHEDDPVRSLLSTLRLSLEAYGISPTYGAALDAIRGNAIAGQERMPRLPASGETVD